MVFDESDRENLSARMEKEPYAVAQAVRGERERQDERDGQEHHVRQEPTYDVRDSAFRKPRTLASRSCR